VERVRLKVCGITSLVDALTAVNCGAHYLGFNFYPPSPRYIAPEAALAIIEQLPDEVVSIGVFVNEAAPETVLDSMRRSGVRLAQLHGDEDAAYCAAVGAERVIKALRVAEDFDARSVLNYPASAILLDAYDKKLYGGTGKTANWALANEAARMTKIFLAGGLSPDNISAAIRAVEPFAVDVNSGVERAPGVKDAEKLQALKQAIETCR
jgi:phosphoribosylanthranilate isomerase